MNTFANIPHHTHLVVGVFKFDDEFIGACDEPQICVSGLSERDALQKLREKLHEILNPESEEQLCIYL